MPSQRSNLGLAIARFLIIIDPIDSTSLLSVWESSTASARILFTRSRPCHCQIHQFNRFRLSTSFRIINSLHQSSSRQIIIISIDSTSSLSPGILHIAAASLIHRQSYRRVIDSLANHSDRGPCQLARRATYRLCHIDPTPLRVILESIPDSQGGSHSSLHSHTPKRERQLGPKGWGRALRPRASAQLGMTSATSSAPTRLFNMATSGDQGQDRQPTTAHLIQTMMVMLTQMDQSQQARLDFEIRREEREQQREKREQEDRERRCRRRIQSESVSDEDRKRPRKNFNPEAVGYFNPRHGSPVWPRDPAQPTVDISTTSHTSAISFTTALDLATSEVG